jgi:hypothetical protein
MSHWAVDFFKHRMKLRHKAQPCRLSNHAPSSSAIGESKDGGQQGECTLLKTIGSKQRVNQSLQRLQEVDEILHLLRRESGLETFVIEIDDLCEIRRRSVVEIRRTGSKAPQDRSLGAADIGALS